MEICVFSTINQLEADMIKNALDENKIDNYLKNYSVNCLGLGGWTVPFAGANLAFGEIKVMVNENDMEKALEIAKKLFREEDDQDEFEGPVASSNNLVSLDEDYNTEEIIEEGVISNEEISKENKKHPIRNFLVFVGLAILVAIALSKFI